jgi:hypothetical protein
MMMVLGSGTAFIQDSAFINGRQTARTCNTLIFDTCISSHFVLVQQWTIIVFALGL